jgi:hypothetical protein
LVSPEAPVIGLKMVTFSSLSLHAGSSVWEPWCLFVCPSFLFFLKKI